MSASTTTSPSGRGAPLAGHASPTASVQSPPGKVAFRCKCIGIFIYGRRRPTLCKIEATQSVFYKISQ